MNLSLKGFFNPLTSNHQKMGHEQADEKYGKNDHMGDEKTGDRWLFHSISSLKKDHQIFPNDREFTGHARPDSRRPISPLIPS
jgi:hypothetical protein